MKITKLKWAMIREEVDGGGDGGGDTSGPSDFVKLAKERGKQTVPQAEPDPGLNSENGGSPKPEEFQRMEIPDGTGNAQKPAEKPAEKPAGGGKEAVEADLAKMLLGVIKPESSDKKVEAKPSESDDPLADLIPDMPAAPAAGASVGEQFEHVKAVGAKYKAKLIETVREIKELKSSNMSVEDRARLKILNDEKAQLVEANDALKKEQEDIRKRLAAYDLREDPEFQRLYVEPVKAKEREVIEMIGMIGGNNPDDLRKRCTAALSAANEADFRSSVNEIAEELGGFDGADIRREMFALRKLYTAQNAAQADLDTTSLNVTKSKAERGKLAATAFLDKDVSDSIDSIAQSDPMVALLGTDAARGVLAKHVTTLDAYDKQINDSITAETSRRGGISRELAPVVALAKIRVRERIIFGQAIEQLQAQVKENAELRAQYRKATGRDFVVPTGGTPTSGGESQSGDEPVGLVAFAKKQGVF